MGTSIARRYVLLGPIGQGGLTVVYAAVDTVIGRRVAIKLPARQFAANPAAHDRMRHEALITQRLRSPSVPRVYDHGETVLAGGALAPYVAMELLTGAVLAGRLTGAALPWTEAVMVAATAADVLAVAHRHGIVHRDLTPTNIMLTDAGPKIIDFGEAAALSTGEYPGGAGYPGTLDHRRAGGLPGGATKAPGPAMDSVLPTRRFTSGQSPADDVYSLGVLLYQMLTGRSPYANSRPADDLAAARLRWVAPTPVLVVPGMPRELAEACRRYMAKRPEDRPTSVAAALELWSLLIPERAAVPSSRTVPGALAPTVRPAPAAGSSARVRPAPARDERRARGGRAVPGWAGPSFGGRTPARHS
jgi:serine/threonine-protein kinase